MQPPETVAGSPRSVLSLGSEEPSGKGSCLLGMSVTRKPLLSIWVLSEQLI